MGGLSLMHWIIVLGVVLIFFGPKRLPELAKSLGKGIREFKDALSGEGEKKGDQVTKDTKDSNQG
ncbi:MAG: twin-arginine translocase TatA/TatE family subunit [Deltaproteobacteria bacterium]|nr:twin-arginine translocase TatA/TatE family subunit [Deltaproteobacteria bacterium]